MARCVSPISIPHPHGTTKAVRLTVPCGKCINCYSNKRADWTLRLMEELKVCDTAYFITLTYNDENLTGELNKKHIQDYIKRLRYSLDEWYQEIQLKEEHLLKAPQLRYFIVGEYGAKSKRPHYHGIFYNLPMELEEKFIEKWSIGTGKYYKNEKDITTELKEELGFVHIGTVNQSSIHYTTKYMLDALMSTESISKDQIQKPFNLMSKYPPLGLSYVKKNKKYHRASAHNYYTHPGGIKQRLPRIYKDKMFTNKEKEKFAEETEKEINRLEEIRIQKWKKKGIKEDYHREILLNKIKNTQKKLKQGKI